MTIDQPISAAVDLGSNTFRLLVAGHAAGRLQIFEKHLATVRLGEGVAQSGRLQPHAMDRGLDVLYSFRIIMDNYRLQTIRVCGTEALRRARNSIAFLQRAQEILLHDIDIITGEEEAALTLTGALSGCSDISGTVLLADVGGGSTELIHAVQTPGPTRVESIGLGAVGLTEKFLAGPQHDPATMDVLLTGTIETALKKLHVHHAGPAAIILGCGGTATSLAALDLKLSAYEETLVHGHILHADRLENLWKRLTAMAPASRNELPCLGEGRGEILPAGLRIYQILIKLLGADRLRVSDTGLLEGILLGSLPDLS